MYHHDVRTPGIFSIAREFICYVMRLLFRRVALVIFTDNISPLQ